jgi:hypothetical protein
MGYISTAASYWPKSTLSASHCVAINEIALIDAKISIRGSIAIVPDVIHISNEQNIIRPRYLVLFNNVNDGQRNAMEKASITV